MEFRWFEVDTVEIVDLVLECIVLYCIVCSMRYR